MNEHIILHYSYIFNKILNFIRRILLIYVITIKSIIQEKKM